MTALENVMIGAANTADVAGAREAARAALARRARRPRGRARPRPVDGPAQAPRAGARAGHPAAAAPARRGAGGVDPAIPGLVALVRDLHARGLALIVIEHNMRVIMEIAQRVLALQLGEVIADGPPRRSCATSG